MNAGVILCALGIYRGDLCQAREALAPIEHAAESRETLRASRLHLMQAWLTAEEGDLPRALRIAWPLLAAADNGCHAWAWSPAWMRKSAGMARRTGDTAIARQAAHIADLGARRNPGVATLAGVALQVTGYLAGDAEVLRRAVVIMRRSPRQLLVANTLRDLGDVLVAQGIPDEGNATLREACDLYDQTGAAGYARALRAKHPAIGAARSRRAVATRPAHGWDALTETEARVADLIIAGHSNRSAAAELGVSTNTVGTHLRSIFAKLDVHSRVQLTNTARAVRS